MDALAVETGALTRRRGVSGGEAFVRALLLYGLPKASFKRALIMAREPGIDDLNTTAMFNRLSRSERLLSSLFLHALRFCTDRAEEWNGPQLVAVEATYSSGPGATGTDQNLHTVYDLSKGIPRSVKSPIYKEGKLLFLTKPLVKAISF